MKKIDVLICDDHEGVREALKLILGDFYELSFAVDAKDAQEQLKQKFYGILILDVRMPGQSGLEALEDINKLSPRTKIIITTAYKIPETKKQALSLNVAGFLEKPFDSEKVLELVGRTAGNIR